MQSDDGGFRCEFTARAVDDLYAAIILLALLTRPVINTLEKRRGLPRARETASLTICCDCHVITVADILTQVCFTLHFVNLISVF